MKLEAELPGPLMVGEAALVLPVTSKKYRTTTIEINWSLFDENAQRAQETYICQGAGA